MSSNNRIIGRVLSVDNFRVFIKIEEDLRGTYKSGVLDVYEIARINSYLIIPVGADRVVALITRVTMKEEVEFEENANSQVFPDFYLDKHNKKLGLLEVKSFDWDRGPGFDLANFDSYCNSLLSSAYRLNSDYLIFAYQMNGSEITIKNVWLKKIWELACPSGTYPLKVQEKKSVIYNIRPSTWYSERTKIKPFNSLEEFLSALNETRYQYPLTRHTNGHWLQNVLKNYEEHTGVKLQVR